VRIQKALPDAVKEEVLPLPLKVHISKPR